MCKSAGRCRCRALGRTCTAVSLLPLRNIPALQLEQLLGAEGGLAVSWLRNACHPGVLPLVGAQPVLRCRSCTFSTYFPLAAEQLSPCCSSWLHTHVMLCDDKEAWV